MNPDVLYARYQELQVYVGWSSEDVGRIIALGPVLAPVLPALIDDFYEVILKHPGAEKVITGGPAQVQRLRGTLLVWLRELLEGNYDREYVVRRWRVGWRHVDIGLDQVYTNVALSRLRDGLLRSTRALWKGTIEDLFLTLRALNLLLDLDLAIIEDAYQAEHLARLQRIERVAAQARAEFAFRALVEAAPCLIVLLRPDGAILYFNRYAEEVTGQPALEVLGKEFAKLLIPDPYRAVVIEQLERVVSGQAIRGVETPVVCRDGSRRWVLWNAQHLPASTVPAPQDGEAGSGPGLLAIGQDITALKHSLERTLQAERLAAIGQMVTGLAHESGNALARSQACLEMLALEVQDRSEALSLLGRIQNAQNHLQQLYDEVRNYAAPLKLEREPWLLDAVWRQAWSNLAHRLRGRTAHLHEETRSLDLRCVIDPFRLEQVFRNIFENSLAACSDPVEMRILCAEGLIEGSPGVHLVLRDNGPGLSNEVRRRMFEPFFTTRTKGTGLGMAIARRIIEAHGGQIIAGEADSARTGAEIHILLPREGP